MVVAIEKRRHIDGKPLVGLRPETCLVIHHVLGLELGVTQNNDFHWRVRSCRVGENRQRCNEVSVSPCRAAFRARNRGPESQPVGGSPRQPDARLNFKTGEIAVFNLGSGRQKQPVGLQGNGILHKECEELEL